MSVQPLCAIACINICAHFKKPKQWQLYYCWDTRKYCRETHTPPPPPHTHTHARTHADTHARTHARTHAHTHTQRQKEEKKDKLGKCFWLQAKHTKLHSDQPQSQTVDSLQTVSLISATTDVSRFMYHFPRQELH